MNANDQGTEDGLREAIARRAYELFARRGYIHGYDVEDWLQAELELAMPAKDPQLAHVGLPSQTEVR